MRLRTFATALLTVGLLGACSEIGDDLSLLEPPAGPNLSQELTPEEEAELESCARLTGTDVVIWWGQFWENDDPTIDVTTEAVWYCIVPVRLKGQGTAWVDAESLGDEMNYHVPLYDHFTKQVEGYKRKTFTDLGTIDCDVWDSARIRAETNHWARWEYFKFGNLLNITKGPYSDSSVERCEGLPQSGGTPQGGSTTDGCQVCQQWFWVADGQVVDEWWECEPVHEGDPEYAYCPAT